MSTQLDRLILRLAEKLEAEPLEVRLVIPLEVKPSLNTSRHLNRRIELAPDLSALDQTSGRGADAPRHHFHPCSPVIKTLAEGLTDVLKLDATPLLLHVSGQFRSLQQTGLNHGSFNERLRVELRRVPKE